MSGKRIRSGSGTGRHDHPNAVAVALHAFGEALADRYLEVMDSGGAVPGPPHLEGASPDLWDNTSTAAKAHLEGGYCKFRTWYRGGGTGDGFRDVVCDSRLPETFATEYGQHNFTCGMGQLFATAFEWAWKDREYVFERVPPFSAQNVDALKTTRDTYINAAEAFGFDYGSPEGWDIDGTFSLDDVSGSILDMVSGFSLTEAQSSKDWMVGWTGAAAEAAAHGFFHSTLPTTSNQAAIADALAYLVNLRATIIDRNRANTLDLIDSATAALGETRDVDLVGRWRVVQGIGMAISLTGPGAVVGAPLTFVSWLGEHLYPVKKDAAFASEPHEVAAALADAFDSMARDIQYAEADFRDDAGRVESEIGAASLEVLELYDITQNDPDGTAGKDGGFTVDVNEITSLAQQCYAVADAYAEVRTRLRDLYDGDPHMTDRDGDRSSGDEKVLSMREDLLNFVGTTIGRYSLMGSQLEEAAREYSEGDESSARSFELWDESMEDHGNGPPVSQTYAEALAEPTDRNSTAPSGETEDNFVYDSEAWDHPDAPEPEKQGG